MNDLVVKNVPFCGTELLAVQERGNGKIYAGINLLLAGLGFNEYQTRYRREKWLEDKSLSKGVRKFSHPSDKGGMQEAYCIDIMKLPLALAKLEITPKMEKEMPELSAKLEDYQDRCADVLAEAFLPKKKEKQNQSGRTEIMMMNARSRMAQTYLRLAEVDTLSSTYKTILVAKASEVLAGEQLLPLPKNERKEYSAGEIGGMFGISGNKVGRIANEHNLKTEKYGEYRRSKSEHSSKEVDTWVYFDTVIPVIGKILGQEVA
ncbi:MAG: phage antirepressor N-terminal domain-containing protein [Clostridium sp.]|nr:phage antirepressor N-terminal domain-containing protein [Clostridium sp.]